ncbi:hypothetical protein EV356DRAFT_365045 [Viridothelium virens]|uniref:Secreted protein n=1 Tax=Viridothelium virens TaxID=1048519 RepID=A0A6A6GWL8_VIRVR|nr:hypothetical protein EV356DRAFT_365045 [Viridothelium virens]
MVLTLPNKVLYWVSACSLLCCVSSSSVRKLELSSVCLSCICSSDFRSSVTSTLKASRSLARASSFCVVSPEGGMSGASSGSCSSCSTLESFRYVPFGASLWFCTALEDASCCDCSSC